MKKEKIYYDIVKKRGNGSTMGSRERYFTQLHSKGKVGKKQYLSFCRESCGVKRDEMLSALGVISCTILSLVLDGYTVDVPHLGKFKLSTRSRTALDRQDAGKQAIQFVKMVYRPSPEMQKYFCKDNVKLVEYPTSQRE